MRVNAVCPGTVYSTKVETGLASYGVTREQAETGENPRKIIQRAVKAAGGGKNLRKFRKAKFTEKGTYYGMGDGVEYTGKYAVEFPNKFHMEIEGVFTMVLNGKKGWVKMAGEVKEMDPKQRRVMMSNHRVGWIMQLYPLLSKKTKFELTAIDGVPVDKRPTVGVKVTRKFYPEVKLYFDKESGLLVKCVNKTRTEPDFLGAARDLS